MVLKLASNVLAAIGKLVMVTVFIRLAAKPVPKV
jgi:hypothetical protein